MPTGISHQGTGQELLQRISRSLCIIYSFKFGDGGWAGFGEKFVLRLQYGFLKKDSGIKLFLNKCFRDLDLDLINKLKDLGKWDCLPQFFFLLASPISVTILSLLSFYSFP